MTDELRAAEQRASWWAPSLALGSKVLEPEWFLATDSKGGGRGL